MLSGLVLALASTSLVPWGRLQGFLGFLQFPWRLFVAAGPLLAFAEGIYLGKLSEGRRADRVVLVMLTGLMLLSAFSNLQKNDQEYYSYSDDYFDYRPFTTDVLGGEWLPEKVEDRERLAAEADLARDDRGREYEVRRIKNELELSDLGKDCVYVDVPFVYYKGYAAEDGETGRRLALSDEGQNGLVRVFTDGAKSIRVFYAGTVIQHLSDGVTLITLLTLVIFGYCSVPSDTEKTIGGEK